MYILLFIIIKITKFKFVSRMECVPFVDLIHIRRGEIPLKPQKQDILVLRGKFSPRIIIIRCSELELMFINIKLTPNHRF